MFNRLSMFFLKKKNIFFMTVQLSTIPFLLAIDKLYVTFDLCTVDLVQDDVFTHVGEMAGLQLINVAFASMLGKRFFPYNTTSLISRDSEFVTFGCGTFYPYEPTHTVWQDNQVSCDCRMNFLVAEDSVENGVVPMEVLEGSTCVGANG